MQEDQMIEWRALWFESMFTDEQDDFLLTQVAALVEEEKGMEEECGWGQKEEKWCGRRRKRRRKQDAEKEIPKEKNYKTPVPHSLEE